MGKLRWERAEGKIFRLGREITPEEVEESWGAITGFEKATHPVDIAASMQPIIANLESRRRGGNEFIDVDAALGYEFPPLTSSYDERDLALYALGVGAAHNPLDDTDLKLVYEMHGDGFNALPTFAVTPPLNVMRAGREKRPEGAGPQLRPRSRAARRAVHRGQAAAPATGEADATAEDQGHLRQGQARARRVVGFDERRDTRRAVLQRAHDVRARRGRLGRSATAGRRPAGIAGVNVPPDRAPDGVVTERIPENQALLYRLSGDWNPLHADPGFAKAFGFDRPILHGLCTFGYAARHVIRQFAPNGDPRFFKSIKVRFAEAVFPGETIKTEMWRDEDRIVFRSSVVERGKVVISNAAIAFHAEIPNDASGQRFTAATSSQRRGSVVTSKRSQTAPTASMSAAATTSDG